MSEPTPIKVVFTHKHGQPVGPMRVVFDDDDEDHPDQPSHEWTTRRNAVQVAEALGVPLEER